MPRNSETIGALAAALAKAQAELTNPEKSLTGILPGAGQGGSEGRSFRYASLASGLEIVRQCLSRHEIAIVQSTGTEDAGGVVRLTTMLVHSSGEWMSSDWPVCPMSEIKTPQRMGAALTYARRYGLFTLVGITGEDDLDAPDLAPGSPKALPDSAQAQFDQRGNEFNSTAPQAARRIHANGASRPRQQPIPRPCLLSKDRSALERDRLLRELEGIDDPDQLAVWAQGTLPTKNTLVAEDATLVETAFAERISACSATSVDSDHADTARESQTGGAPAELTSCAQDETTKSAKSGALNRDATLPPACAAAGPKTPRRRASRRKAPGIDKSVLAFPEPRRVRDREHLRFVARQPCLLCGRTPSDAHHLRFAQLRALGRKVSDEFTVPLCRAHHREIHRTGDEVGWWQRQNVEPLTLAGDLWRRTHPLPRSSGMAVEDS